MHDKGVAPAITDLIGGQLKVPTTAEAGAPQLPVKSWTAVTAPASTPEAMVAKLSAAVLEIVATPDMDVARQRVGLPRRCTWLASVRQVPG